jgi:hypothetical protein
MNKFSINKKKYFINGEFIKFDFIRCDNINFKIHNKIIHSEYNDNLLLSEYFNHNIKPTELSYIYFINNENNQSSVFLKKMGEQRESPITCTTSDILFITSKKNIKIFKYKNSIKISYLNNVKNLNNLKCMKCMEKLSQKLFSLIFYDININCKSDLCYIITLIDQINRLGTNCIIKLPLLDEYNLIYKYIYILLHLFSNIDIISFDWEFNYINNKPQLYLYCNNRNSKNLSNDNLFNIYNNKYFKIQLFENYNNYYKFFCLVMDNNINNIINITKKNKKNINKILQLF